MKYLKRFNESKIHIKIDEICNKYGIENYTINVDGSVDVDGDVYLVDEKITKKITKIPLKFGEVTGDFYCSGNELISLEGSPKIVGRGFHCDDNKLISLTGSPKIVGRGFSCSNNQLTSLISSPEIVKAHFMCNKNKLTSLEGAPIKIGGDFYCNNNKLTSLMHCSEFRNLFCDDNPVEVIWELFRSNGGNIGNRFVDKINHIYTDLHLGDGWTIQGDIIEQIAEELRAILPKRWKEGVENKGYKII